MTTTSGTPHMDKALAECEHRCSEVYHVYEMGKKLERELQQVRVDAMICTGCGHNDTPVEPPHIACCPDGRYRNAKEILEELWEAEADLATARAENERLKNEVIELRYRLPPCQECGALTQREAEQKCICSGDKDDCHGCKLWPD